MSGQLRYFPDPSKKGGGGKGTQFMEAPLKVRLLASFLPLLMGLLMVLRGDQVLGMAILMLVLFMIYIRGQKVPLLRIMSGLFLVLNLYAFIATPYLLGPYLAWVGVVYFLLKFHRTVPSAASFIRFQYLQNIATFSILLLITLFWGHFNQVLIELLRLFGVSNILQMPIPGIGNINTLIFYLLLFISAVPILLLIVTPLLGKTSDIPFITKIARNWPI